MQKTVFKARVCLYNPRKRHFYDYFDRRVYVGDDGHGYIRLFGEYRPMSDYYRTSNGGKFQFTRVYVYVED